MQPKQKVAISLTKVIFIYIILLIYMLIEFISHINEKYIFAIVNQIFVVFFPSVILYFSFCEARNKPVSL